MCLKQRLQIICLKASSCIFLCYVFLFWNSNFSFVFLKWNKTFADMFCGESLAAVIKKFAAQLDQVLSLTVGGSVTFWVLVFEHLLSTALSSIKRLIFFFFLFDSPKDFCTNMFTNTTSCFYVTKLLCHRTSDFDVVIEWFSKSWIFWSWGLKLLFHGLIEV